MLAALSVGGEGSFSLKVGELVLVSRADPEISSPIEKTPQIGWANRRVVERLQSQITQHTRVHPGSERSQQQLEPFPVLADG